MEYLSTLINTYISQNKLSELAELFQGLDQINRGLAPQGYYFALKESITLDKPSRTLTPAMALTVCRFFYLDSDAKARYLIQLFACENFQAGAALIQEGIQLSAKMKADAEYLCLKPEIQHLITAQFALFDMKRFLQNSELKSFKVALNTVMKEDAKTLATYIDEMTQLQTPNPFTLSQWTQLTATLDQHYFDQLSKHLDKKSYEQYRHPENQAVSSSQLSQVQAQEAQEKAQRILAGLYTIENAVTEQERETLNTYFQLTENNRTPNAIKITAEALKILGDHKTDFEFYLSHPDQLAANLMPTQLAEVLREFKKQCGMILTRGNDRHVKSVALKPVVLIDFDKAKRLFSSQLTWGVLGGHYDDPAKTRNLGLMVVNFLSTLNWDIKLPVYAALIQVWWQEIVTSIFLDYLTAVYEKEKSHPTTVKSLHDLLNAPLFIQSFPSFDYDFVLSLIRHCEESTIRAVFQDKFYLLAEPLYVDTLFKTGKSTLAVEFPNELQSIISLSSFAALVNAKNTLVSPLWRNHAQFIPIIDREIATLQTKFESMVQTDELRKTHYMLFIATIIAGVSVPDFKAFIAHPYFTAKGTLLHFTKKNQLDDLGFYDSPLYNESNGAVTFESICITAIQTKRLDLLKILYDQNDIRCLFTLEFINMLLKSAAQNSDEIVEWLLSLKPVDSLASVSVDQIVLDNQLLLQGTYLVNMVNSKRFIKDHTVAETIVNQPKVWSSKVIALLDAGWLSASLLMATFQKIISQPHSYYFPPETATLISKVISHPEFAFSFVDANGLSPVEFCLSKINELYNGLVLAKMRVIPLLLKMDARFELAHLDKCLAQLSSLRKQVEGKTLHHADTALYAEFIAPVKLADIKGGIPLIITAVTLHYLKQILYHDDQTNLLFFEDPLALWKSFTAIAGSTDSNITDLMKQKAKAGHQLASVKDWLVNNRLWVFESHIDEALQKSFAAYPAILLAFVNKIIQGAEKNPFTIEQWAKFKKSMNKVLQNNSTWVHNCKDFSVQLFAAYIHPLDPQLKNVQAKAQSSSATSSTSSSIVDNTLNNEAQYKISSCAGEVVTELLADYTHDELTLVMSLFAPTHSDLAVYREQQKPQRQQARALLTLKKDEHILNYLAGSGLLAASDIPLGLESKASILFTETVFTQLSAGLKNKSASSTLADLPTQSASSTSDSPAQLIAAQRNSPVFSAIPVSAPRPATDEDLQRLDAVVAPTAEPEPVVVQEVLESRGFAQLLAN